MPSSAISTVDALARDLSSGSLREKDKAIDDLIHLLNPNNRVNLSDLKDSSFHSIFEGVFSFVLREKPTFYDKRKSQATSKAATTRLTKCATAIRVTASRAVSKIGRKTLHAIIEHITQVLPAPDEGFVPPLLQDYVKTLTELVSRQVNVESLSRKDASSWEVCVDFFIGVLEHHLPEDSHEFVVTLGRASSVPASSSLRSMVRSSSSSLGRKNASQAEGGGPLRDALEGLRHLVTGANAPVLRRFEPIATLVSRILRMRQLSLTSTQTLCFSIANHLFSVVEADSLSEATSLAKNLLPLMSHWWRADKVSQDDVLKALRSEISRGIYLMHLHMEHLAINLDDPAVRTDVENLVEPLWQEYSKRDEAFRLQLGDITFKASILPPDAMHIGLFGLRPHNLEGEGQWATVQNIALLEAILMRSQKQSPANRLEGDEQPRKKRRTYHEPSPVRLKLKSKDEGIIRTALQAIPFMLASNTLAKEEVKDLLVDLVAFAGNKSSITASWAFIACSSIALWSNASHDEQDVWKQLWHLGARSISLPATARAACLLLHSIIDEDIIPYQILSDDINSIVTTSDVNGPGIICDTSLALMHHIFHIRNARLPNASQSTSSHIIRWAFMKWNPSDLTYASFQSIHVSPIDFVNLLRVAFGSQPLKINSQATISGGSLSEAWKSHHEIGQFSEYLLLLGHQVSGVISHSCTYYSKTGNAPPVVDANNFFVAKKLTMELLSPKLDDLRELCSSWNKRASEGGSQISLDRFQSFLSACFIGSMLIPNMSDLNNVQASSAEELLLELAEQGVRAALDSVEPHAFVQLVLRDIQPCIPKISTSNLTRMYAGNRVLFRLLSMVSELLELRQSSQFSGVSGDLMDLDDEFESQSSKTNTATGVLSLPRQSIQLTLNPLTFYTDTRLRLALLRALYADSSQIGLIPSKFIHQLLELSDEDFLFCKFLLVDIFRSDLVADSESALNVIERLGSLVSDPEYSSCEVAQTACIDVMDSMTNLWIQDNPTLADRIGDLYNHFVKVCFSNNVLSAATLKSLARLLFTLLRVDPEYGTNLGLDSCRTSLLLVLGKGPMRLKCFIADKIPAIFELFVLMVHDEIFVDVLNSLPADPLNTAGIAFRLLVLSKMACQWPTLLRRCIYHIFETPGKIGQSLDYARRCLADISNSLKLGSPKELFQLFSRQLLYTWLESDSIRNIPFSIFGYDKLEELLSTTQAEVLGLVMMRGQEDAYTELAQALGTKEVDLVKKNFTTTLSYSMVYVATFPTADKKKGEERVKNAIGSKAFIEAVYANFVDIVALFFDLVDQEDSVERVFMKQHHLKYAGDNLEAIKKISHSPSKLPPNQQPMFRAKYVFHELFRLCQGTEYQFRDLWTPALVTSIARSLFNTVHPALGSLHACSVLRKVRILICLAGPVALESYCLEMLLNSMRSFIVDSECADDALGISQYLLSGGQSYLSKTPSFLAGYSLSILASLRVFLESSQSSTTQESQFKATMNKAQHFHSWFSRHLSNYSSQQFENDSQAESFKSITESAGHIRSSGNAEKNTFESKLLLDILRDEASESQLLNESSRQLALGLLCGDFTIPTLIANDVIEDDEDAICQAAAVWKSCEAQNLSENYLAWAGRVVGRSFAASGVIPEGILPETKLIEYDKIAPAPHGSEMGLLCLLQSMTADPNSVTAGLAEATLRSALSQAIAEEDAPLVNASQRSLSESLFQASQWGLYRSPPSETDRRATLETVEFSWSEEITSKSWLSNLSAHLAMAVPDSYLLSAIAPVLMKVEGFAEKAFPFIVHLVLFFQLEHQQTIKRQLSSSLKQWLSCPEHNAKGNIKLLLNTIIYLRTQEYPKESSIADRLHWLDIDYSVAASSATRCGMYKTALLFAELVSSEANRSSRRISVAKEADVTEVLLTIFENIDDPDAYYGLPEDASLSKVLARLEFEQDGTKSLAFRGAQLDSHMRLQHSSVDTDGQALVKTLGSLGFAGLSHSVLQSQQNTDSSNSSLASTFGAARKLEMWNLPVPTASDHHAVITYKAYQTINRGASIQDIRSSIYGGFSRTMQSLVNNSHNAIALRNRLGALAALSELDELLNIGQSAEAENLMQRFEERGEWMKSGVYEDVSQILSCRGSTMSMASQHPTLFGSAALSISDLRQMQVKSMLQASSIYRYHQAMQESLNISTALSDIVRPCEDMGIHIDAAVKIEVANSLWDHGEMSTSIRILQTIEKDAALKKQAIPVSKSDLLSKIGHKISVARLEKPRDIQKKYLEPALKELKAGLDGTAAGLVFHQFAAFCDQQLQDADSLEDLERLQNLKRGKNDEVEELKSLIASTRDSQLKTKYNHVLSKEKQWLDLDEQELRRVEHTRNEFVRLSLENYLLSLASSDDHNNDALRFTALWLERSDEETTNKAVGRHLSQVPTYKFAGLMSQLTSRLQDNNSSFQQLLFDLVLNICAEHPYHGMYHIWSGTKARTQQKDEVAVLRVKATERVAQKLSVSKTVGGIWHSIDRTSKYYHALAMDRNPARYKSGAKIALRESGAAHNLMNCLAKHKIPPPTMHIEVNPSKDYSNVPVIAKLEPTMSIASGVSAPKIITAVGTDGGRYKQLVKGGQDDLRQDAIMEQVFSAVSSLLKLHRATQQRNLGIRTYKVLPLTASSGLIEFVKDTIPLHEFLMPAHERYHPRDLKGSQCRKEIFSVQNRSVEQRISTYRKVTEKFQPVMRYFFLENFADPDDWFERRLAYTRSTAAISMLGHVLGVGDRHGHNILLDTETGEAVHIDLGIAFEAGRILPVPELVPFRLTRDIVDGMGITKTEGVFRRCCEFTLDALREEQYSIMTILDVLRYDPLYTWTVSPLRLAKLQKARQDDEVTMEDADQADAEAKKGKRLGGYTNEPSEGDRALEVVRKKLSKTLSVTATVNDLINQATDERNLAVLYSGWAAYA